MKTRPSCLARPLVRATALCVAILLTLSPAVGKKKKKDGVAGAGQTLTEVVGESEKKEGLITFYRSPEELYLQVPENLVGVPLGLTGVLVNAVGDWSVRGSSLGTSVVEWRRTGDRLMLIKKNLMFRAADDSPMRHAVDATFPDSPAFVADLIELSDEPRPILVHGAELFGPELMQILPPAAGFSASSEDGTLVSLKVFPDNVVVRMIYHFQRGEPGGREEIGSPFSRFLGPGRLADPRSVEVTVDYHLYRLPDDGFRPRLADERIGVFTDEYKDYTGIDHRDTAFRHLAIRWDTRQPITFYLDRSIPPEWRELVRDGALWWNTAFAEFGIEAGVRVLDQPDDPDWDPADLHHSMIYWNLSDNLIFSGLAGPMLVDPRTGQVLKSNAYLNAEFPSYTLHRYLVYAWWRAPEPGAEHDGQLRDRLDELRRLHGQSHFCDRQASFSSQIAFARLVLQSRGQLKPGDPESTRFAEEAFLELVAHEVGHALGFPHNWKASMVSDGDALAAGSLTGRAEGGPFSASVMDYNPIHLVPRGVRQGDYFLQELGPYDVLSVEYLYRPLDDLSPADEARELDAIAARAETELGLVYDGGELGEIDPTSNADDLGDDPLGFADARFTMIHEEVLPRLPELVLAEGHDYSLIPQALDAAIFSVAMDYIDLVARHIGGQILLRRVANSPAALAGGPPPITPIEPVTVVGWAITSSAAIAM